MNRSKQQWVQEGIWAVALSLAMFLATRVGWVEPVVIAMQGSLVPVASRVTTVIQYIEQPFFSLSHLYSSTAELAEVKTKYATALAQLSQLEQYKAENQQLRKMIENRYLALSPRVIAVPIVSYAYPAIAAGSNQQIGVGGLIVTADTLLGRVSAVLPAEAQVELLINKDARPVLAETESGFQGLVKGTGRSVILTQLPAEATIDPGERIITVGQPGIKAGIFVGVVAADQVIATSPVKTVPIDQLVSFYTTPLVEVW